MKQTNVPTFSRSFIAIALLFGSIILSGIVVALTLVLKKNPYVSLFLLVFTIIGATIFVLQYWGAERNQFFRKLGRYILMSSLTTLVVFFLIGCANRPQANPESSIKASNVSNEMCTDPNEKIEVYPANDGMGGSLSSKSSNRPVVYCNKEDLFKKRKKLWVEEPKPEVTPQAK